MMRKRTHEATGERRHHTKAVLIVHFKACLTSHSLTEVFSDDHSSVTHLSDCPGQHTKMCHRKLADSENCLGREEDAGLGKTFQSPACGLTFPAGFAGREASPNWLCRLWSVLIDDMETTVPAPWDGCRI